MSSIEHPITCLHMSIISLVFFTLFKSRWLTRVITIMNNDLSDNTSDSSDPSKNKLPSYDDVMTEEKEAEKMNLLPSYEEVTSKVSNIPPEHVETNETIKTSNKPLIYDPMFGSPADSSILPISHDQQRFPVSKDRSMIEICRDQNKKGEIPSSDQNCLISGISQSWRFCVDILNIIWENLKKMFIWIGNRVFDILLNVISGIIFFLGDLLGKLYQRVLYFLYILAQHGRITVYLIPTITTLINAVITFYALQNLEITPKDSLHPYMIFLFLYKSWEWYSIILSIFSIYCEFKDEQYPQQIIIFILKLWIGGFLGEIVYYLMILDKFSTKELENKT